MSPAKPITVAGGGLAGLALGIALRRKDVPVILFEAGRYPRHRVCGEFISGRGLDTITRLGLREPLLSAGARPAQTAAFATHRGTKALRRLPEPALCCSRFVMDAVLAGEFQKLGGELRANERWNGGWGDAVVRASGRRVQATDEGWRLFGLKAHARRVALSADLEMHLRPEGYVGLCQLADGVVNVCGLFRSRETVPTLRESWQAWLRGKPGSPLYARLAEAEFMEDSFCSVAGFTLQPQAAAAHSECSVGDALTMIPPVTGNGMSIAFESAELAAEPLTDFSRGKLGWEAARRIIADRCAITFDRRLIWAARLHRWLMQPLVVEPLVGLAAKSDFFWQTSFALTR